MNGQKRRRNKTPNIEGAPRDDKGLKTLLRENFLDCPFRLYGTAY